MNGRRFLGTARFLQSSGSDEAAFRSAASRAYYACFLAARSVAFAACGTDARRAAGIKNERKIGHVPLQRYLKGGDTDQVRQLGEDLAGLYGIRQDADYDMLKPLSSVDAKDAVCDADAFLKSLDGTNPSDIGRAVESWINKIYRGGAQ